MLNSFLGNTESAKFEFFPNFA